MKLIYIQWEDATACSAWRSETNAKKWSKETKMTIEEVGWILEETDKYITLVGRKSMWEDDENEYGNLQKIPKTWIRKRRVLKI